MKRWMTGLVAAAVAAVTASVCAAPGDVAGTYYSTDIHTILNGAEIDSINIGGETLISAEDMVYYGFSVEWKAAERALWITSAAHAENGAPPVIKKSNYPSGMALGVYYETDITTYLNGAAMTAYNVGGRTYLHAEELRRFGFVVEWVEADRCLFLTAPAFAGYTYTLPLTQGQAQDTEADGGFSLTWTPDGVTGTGDAAYFHASLESTGTEYILLLELSEDTGLLSAHPLLDVLKPLASGGNAYPLHDYEKKYEAVNRTITVSVNGERAEQVAVANYSSNTYSRFYLHIYDLPPCRKDALRELYVCVGDPSALKPVSLVPAQEDAADSLADGLKTYPLDWLVQACETADCTVLYMRESPLLGVVTDRLYLVDKATGACSADILEQVRQYDGFRYAVLDLYAIGVKDVATNLFFSCRTQDRTGDFYVETDTGMVHFIADSRTGGDG